MSELPKHEDGREPTPMDEAVTLHTYERAISEDHPELKITFTYTTRNGFSPADHTRRER